MKYYGYSYWSVLNNRIARAIWKKVFCPKRWHLWDEVLSNKHYLHCDACGQELELK